MKGLTLLEVLISIIILSIILAAIYGAYTSNVETIQIVREHSQVYQTARIVFDRMSKDLESSFIEVALSDEKIKLGMIGKDRDIAGQDADSIDFTTLTHLPLTEKSPRTDLCEVGYYLEEDPENEGFVLYRRDDGILDDDFTEGGYKQELARMVAGLDIIFQDSYGGEFDQWNTLEGKQAGKLPSLIKIRLTIKEQSGREHLFAMSIHPELSVRKMEDSSSTNE
ncbi:MAG: prepilin-type N-terminal cleavage/methylation domain-containing protein [Thermodesulfobacteriota bacterium]|nr:prepilin-type N-terminal cleavage/methylation domain-containing protein [Thermodesulfobacteriota bacterium]